MAKTRTIDCIINIPSKITNLVSTVMETHGFQLQNYCNVRACFKEFGRQAFACLMMYITHSHQQMLLDML